jgi:hypothetical protein
MSQRNFSESEETPSLQQRLFDFCNKSEHSQDLKDPEAFYDLLDANRCFFTVHSYPIYLSQYLRSKDSIKVQTFNQLTAGIVTIPSDDYSIDKFGWDWLEETSFYVTDPHKSVQTAGGLDVSFLNITEASLVQYLIQIEQITYSCLIHGGQLFLVDESNYKQAIQSTTDRAGHESYLNSKMEEIKNIAKTVGLAAAMIFLCSCGRSPEVGHAAPNSLSNASACSVDACKTPKPVPPSITDSGASVDTVSTSLNTVASPPSVPDTGSNNTPTVDNNPTIPTTPVADTSSGGNSNIDSGSHYSEVLDPVLVDANLDDLIHNSDVVDALSETDKINSVFNLLPKAAIECVIGHSVNDLNSHDTFESFSSGLKNLDNIKSLGNLSTNRDEIASVIKTMLATSKGCSKFLAKDVAQSNDELAQSTSRDRATEDDRVKESDSVKNQERTIERAKEKADEEEKHQEIERVKEQDATNEKALEAAKEKLIEQARERSRE